MHRCFLKKANNNTHVNAFNNTGQWRTEGGFGMFNTPPEIPKALQNRAKLNPIVKTVKNCWI